ncbi:thermonuclease family protein [Silvanigrella aquatica]|uniref:TNase-like domain-containing protein n=1 Tax=Silvanigrella aquatica TaxID=1915309 RepID=A0A1L4D2P9_9BACT|nr:thermonuclease family protein [Silvanigrella aquatica]APJ04485.1 hypothetical protein AXG55_11420 [Silvanigrella aquatica]
MLTNNTLSLFRHVFILQILLMCFQIQAVENPSYKVINCHDGDTCKLRSTDNLILKIRLIGIDAPEVSNRKNKDNQQYGKESTDYLNNLIKNKTVQLKNYASDAYGRNLSEIFLNKENINLKMIENGMAEVYKGKKEKEFNIDFYIEAEKKAQKNKLGIWSLKNYQSPKDYRNSHKN